MPQSVRKGLCAACMRNNETPAGFKPKGSVIRPQTGRRNNPSQNPCVRNRASRCRKCSVETLKYTAHRSRQVMDRSMYISNRTRNRQKHKVIGNGCEKAEHHLNPSQNPCVRNRASRCRKRSFETVKIHSTQVKTGKWTVAGI